MPNQEDIDTLKRLLEEAQTAETVQPGAQPFIILPSGHSAFSIEHLLAYPTRKRGCPTFTRAPSFIGYVNEQKTGASRIYVTSQTQFVAVINHHSAEADWSDHRAVLNLTLSPEWVVWKTKNNARMGQRDFAQFVEDNGDDLESPSGAELLDLIRTIKSSTNLECTGEVDDTNEAKAGGFVVHTLTKAGAKQELDLPSEFLLSISPYQGGDRIRVRSRLRLAVQAPKLIIWYEIVKIEDAERRALDGIATTIEKETKMTAWHGTP